MKLRFLLSPFWLSRTLLRRQIAFQARVFTSGKSIIDIGCGEKPHRDLFPREIEYKGIDFARYSENRDFSNGGPDFSFGDDYPVHWRLPFGDNSYDHAVAFEVIEHHPALNCFFSEVNRILKPGGYLLLSWPFLMGIHEEPNDFTRITPYMLQSYAKECGFEMVHLSPIGGLFASIATLITASLAFAYQRRGWMLFFVLVFYPWAHLFQVLMLPLSKFQSRFALGYVATLRKPLSRVRSDEMTPAWNASFP